MKLTLLLEDWKHVDFHNGAQSSHNLRFKSPQSDSCQTFSIALVYQYWAEKTATKWLHYPRTSQKTFSVDIGSCGIRTSNWLRETRWLKHELAVSQFIECNNLALSASSSCSKATQWISFRWIMDYMKRRRVDTELSYTNALAAQWLW